MNRLEILWNINFYGNIFLTILVMLYVHQDITDIMGYVLNVILLVERALVRALMNVKVVSMD